MQIKNDFWMLEKDMKIETQRPPPSLYFPTQKGPPTFSPLRETFSFLWLSYFP